MARAQARRHRDEARSAAPLVVVALAVALAIVAGVAGTARTWDGSFYLFHLLERKRALSIHHRVGVIPLQWPALVAQRFTSRPGVLAGALSAGYASVPILSLVGSWLLVRRRAPRLFVWASVGTLVCVGAGQVFQISEAIVLCQLAWPLLFAVLIGPVAWRAPLVLALTVLAFLVHPGAAVILAVIAVALVARAALEHEARLLLGVEALALLVFAVWRRAIVESGYEKSSASPRGLLHLIRLLLQTTEGVGLVCVGVALALAAVLARVELPGGRILVTLFAVAGAVLVAQGVLAQDMSPLDFRLIAPLIEAPFLLGAATDALIPSRPTWRGIPPGLVQWLLGVGLSAATVLAVMVASIRFASAAHRLDQRVARSGPGCVPQATVVHRDERFLDHWSVPYLLLVDQGRDPTRIALPGGGCDQLRATQLLALPFTGDVPLTTPRWFRLTALAASPSPHQASH
jgi:hypothetical protein